MAVNVGTAYVTVMPSMKGFSAEINSQMGTAGKSSSSAFTKGFSGAAKSFSSIGTSAGNSLVFVLF